MPFTFSHPAAILPATLLPKRYYSFTGLIAGSVAPDFEYFLRVSVNSEYSHTISGIFWFNMPLAFILAWLYHEIVKKPLISNLPDFVRLCIQTFSSFNWKVYVRKNWGIVLVSIIIGAATHLLWDSFTHEEGYFARAIPFLVQEYTIVGHTIAGFKLAQHVSTIIGGLILLLYVYNLPLIQEVAHTKYTGYWWIATLITITVIGIRLLFGIEAHLVNNIIIAGMSGAMLALVITPALLSVFVKVQKPR